MKIRHFLFLISVMIVIPAYAADLLDVYQQALTSDPVYQQAIAQQLAAKQNLPISVAGLLPNIGVTANPTVTRSAFSGANTRGFSPRNNTSRSYTLALTLNQTLFNGSQFAAVAGAKATAREAEATLNAALQNLMVRVANAYFEILKAEDNVSYANATKRAYHEQLDQVKQQYEVGLKTITDVYTAQASYETTSAEYLAAQNTLNIQRENLRTITGVYYPKIATLSENVPLVTPKPANMEAWVKTALLQNWSIRAAQYAVDVARQTVNQQMAGHLPTVNLQGTLDRVYSNNINGYANLSDTNGPSTETDRSVALNITFPLFAGGGVVAQTNQAAYNYRNAQQILEQTVRTTTSTTRQSYLSILSGISQIKADKDAIKSAKSSLQGMEASYKVGTETLVNVLNQQQRVFEAQTSYATDRYAFVNNLFALKQAAGTLNIDDLRAINGWLQENKKYK